MIVSPAASGAPAVVVNAAVQVTPRASAARVVAVNVTAVGAVAGAMTTFAAGLPGTVSALVTTDMFAAVIVCAGGFVTPAIASAPLPLAASTHPAPARVIVTVGPVEEPLVSAAVAVAVQPE